MSDKEINIGQGQYPSVFEISDDAIFISDETGKFVDVNPAACRSLEYSKKELLKLGVKDIDVEPTGYEAFEKVRDGLTKGVKFEVSQLKKDGTTISVEIKGCFFKKGNRRLSMAIARDITGRKRTEEELKEYHVRLEQLVKERTRRLEEEIAERRKVEEELNKKLQDLERFTKITIGRELKMKKLKSRIAELEAKLKK